MNELPELPFDVLLVVMAHCSAFDCHAMARVCRAWRAAAQYAFSSEAHQFAAAPGCRTRYCGSSGCRPKSLHWADVRGPCIEWAINERWPAGPAGEAPKIAPAQGRALLFGLLLAEPPRVPAAAWERLPPPSALKYGAPNYYHLVFPRASDLAAAIEWWCSGPPPNWTLEWAAVAAARGVFPAVIDLLAARQFKPLTPAPRDIALERGSLAVLQRMLHHQWLTPAEVVERAAARGRAEVLRWACSAGGLITTDAAISAVKSGDWETIRCVLPYVKEIPHALDVAAEHGDLRTFLLLREQKNWACDSMTALAAARGFQLETLQWLHAQDAKLITQFCGDVALSARKRLRAGDCERRARCDAVLDWLGAQLNFLKMNQSPNGSARNRN